MARKRPGPKRKPAAKRLSRVIGVRVTEEEYQRLARLAENEHVPVAAWARARLLRSVEDGASLENSHKQFESRQRKQEKTLRRAETLLEETRRLYQSAVERSSKGDPDQDSDKNR